MKEKDPLTPKERETKKKLVIEQTFVASKAGNKKLSCFYCRKIYQLWQLYRCYHCGAYMCEKCAKDHFGKRPKYCGIMERE